MVVKCRNFLIQAKNSAIAVAMVKFLPKQWSKVIKTWYEKVCWHDTRLI